MGFLDDLLDDISYKVKSAMEDVGDFMDDGADFIQTVAKVPEELGAAFKEFGIEVKEDLKESEKEIAYDIHPALGAVVEQKQIVLEKIENLINAPNNLTLTGKIKQEYELADHLFIRRGPYTHHGIYIGDGQVIHYSPSGTDMIEIHPVDLEEFADGHTVYCLSRNQSPLTYTPREAVDRAWERVGEENYNLIINNCEQFVRWCRCGKKEWNE